MKAKAKAKPRLKVQGTLSQEASEMLAMPKDTLVGKADMPERAWSGQDTREALLESLVSDTLGNMLQQARQGRKVTGETLGKRMGVSKARIAQLEGLEGGQVELQTLAQYAHALGYQINISFVSEDSDRKVFSTVL